MGVLSDNAIIGASAAGGYDIDNSCRFNAPDNSYLSRTPGAASNRKTWTWSGWVKRGNPTQRGYLFSSGTAVGSNEDGIEFDGIVLRAYSYVSSSFVWQTTSSAYYRDPAAWYHILVYYDSTQATSADRARLYVNGERLTALSHDTQPSLNADCGFINTTTEHRIGNVLGSHDWDGYLAEVNFIDGLALTPASFAETDVLTNEWKAKKYGGAYGTNGFYLDFSNSAALGADTSGNGNNFTPTNLAATDQMIDTPQNSTGGNFCTLNPLNLGMNTASSGVLSEGNLYYASYNGTAGYNDTYGTFSLKSGKWYWEVEVVNNFSDSFFGICDPSNISNSVYPMSATGAVAWNCITAAPYIRNAGSDTTYGTQTKASNGDILGIAIDLDGETFEGFVNNVSQGSFDFSSRTVGSGVIVPIVVGYSAGSGTSTFVLNFGQDSSFAGQKTAQGNTDTNDCGDFYYTPPTGFLAVCSDNLPDPSIALPGKNFNTILFADGAGAKTGVGFQPDLVWLKARSVGGVGDRYKMTDNVRGVTKGISSNSVTSSPWATVAETTDSTGLTAFGADGFTVGADAYYSSTTGTGMVAWNWLGANTTVSNTEGTITSTVSANTTSGFSICGYTGTGSNATFGHGLSVAPEYVMVKNRATTDDWAVYNTGLTSATYWLEMNDEVAEASGSTIWNSTAPTSTLVNIGSSNNTNKSGDDHIAYCFHSVEGYSKITTYIGTGSAVGPFIYCGFRPAWVLVKEVNGSGDWLVNDSARDGFNPNNRDLGIWRYDASGGGGQFDQLANGLKVRSTAGNVNANGQRMVVLVFAESPFKTSRAR